MTALVSYLAARTVGVHAWTWLPNWWNNYGQHWVGILSSCFFLFPTSHSPVKIEEIITSSLRRSGSLSVHNCAQTGKKYLLLYLGMSLLLKFLSWGSFLENLVTLAFWMWCLSCGLFFVGKHRWHIGCMYVSGVSRNFIKGDEILKNSIIFLSMSGVSNFLDQTTPHLAKQ